jgi:hypothetical protein
MNLRLRLARIYLPAVLKKRKLAELIRLTARAFGAEAPPMERLSLRRMRRLYAEFARDAAARVLGDPAGSGAVKAEVERRLFEEALRFGEDLRRELRVAARPDEVMAAARVLYRGLGIDLRGGADGAIVISRCSFSGDFTPDVCRLSSRLDAGVLAGLSGGWRLEFTERLTEGAACCRARLVRGEDR